jgi:hypothetical protein
MRQALLAWWRRNNNSHHGSDDDDDEPLTTTSACTGLLANFILAIEDEAEEAYGNIEVEPDDQQRQWQAAIETLFGNTPLPPLPVDFTADLPAATSIQHVRQKETWDCGVACLIMVLNWALEKQKNTATSIDDVDRDTLLAELGTKSVWSIDLVWLLHHRINQANNPLPLRYLFSSQSLQVNVSHRKLEYYQPSFVADRERVEILFTRLQYQPAPIMENKRLSLKRIVRLIREPRCIAIALVDHSILSQQSTIQDDAGCTWSSAVNHVYAGHYILLLGISHDVSDMETSHMFSLVIENPAASWYNKSHGRIPVELFMRAWRTPGTDEDIIFLFKHDDYFERDNG